MLWIERLKDWHQERKYRRQRAQRGWSVRDTWAVDSWFLTVVPQMLEYLKEHHTGFPNEVQREYLEAHRDELGMTYEEFCNYPADENSEGYKLREKIDDICDRRWEEILGRMIFLFREANRETCTAQNLCAQEDRWDYQDRCKTEALDLFNKWFWCLWD